MIQRGVGSGHLPGTRAAFLGRCAVRCGGLVIRVGDHGQEANAALERAGRAVRELVSAGAWAGTRSVFYFPQGRMQAHSRRLASGRRGSVHGTAIVIYFL